MDYDKDYVEIGWDPPKHDNGAPIQGYLIQYKEKDSDDWKKVSWLPVAQCSIYLVVLDQMSICY